MSDRGEAGHRVPSPVRVKGWLVLHSPEFEARFVALAEEVARLKERLPEDDYRSHPTVKLFAALFRLVRETVPQDPNARAFQLSGDLSVFCRAKGHGLPERYRLFWVYSERHRTIISLYLNDETTLRKAGARSDPYVVFKRVVAQGRVGPDFGANYQLWNEANSPRRKERVADEIPRPRTGRKR